MLMIDWLMPEEEYMVRNEAQAHTEDINQVLDFLVQSMFMPEARYFANPQDIPEDQRGMYLLITMPGQSRFGGATQKSMDEWSEKVYGVTPYVRTGEGPFLHEGVYYLAEGGGAPEAHNYINKRVDDGDTIRYYHYAYDSDNDANFRGFVQKPESIVELGIKDGYVQSKIKVYPTDSEVNGGVHVAK